MSTTETEPLSESGYTVEPGRFSPPYVSWVTLKNTVEKMAKEGGIPSQIDRSYLSNLPGSTQSALLHAMKSLNLIDDAKKPTEDLETFVDEEDGRKGLVAEILKIHYPGPMGLGKFATQQQLEDEFRKYGVTGSTLRKAVAFFLAAMKYAEVEYSPHFKTPKVVEGGERRQRKPKNGNALARLDDQGDNANAPQGPKRKTFHPFIEGLLLELPAPGSVWPKDQQEKWLKGWEVAFGFIYKTGPGNAQGPAATPREEEAD